MSTSAITRTETINGWLVVIGPDGIPRIRDVDVAEETAAMSRNQVLQQAGVSVLAQANQAPQLAMSLLR